MTRQFRNSPKWALAGFAGTLALFVFAYGIVFSNFMSKGVFTFEGGTDRLIELMHADLLKSGVDVRIKCDAQQIHVENGRVTGITVNGRRIKCRSVVSNSNLKATIFRLVGEQHFGMHGERTGDRDALALAAR